MKSMNIEIFSRLKQRSKFQHITRIEEKKEMYIHFLALYSVSTIIQMGLT